MRDRAGPLDYDQPSGRQISLALIKRPAGDPAHRIGSLFTNPGGPGNSGVDFVRNDAANLHSPSAPLMLINARYDAAASYARARALAQAPPGARLLTVEGAGHTQEAIDSACADAAIERYLVKQQLPAPGATCAQDTDPFSSSA